MKLDIKMNLAVRTLKVGKDRIVFNTTRLEEIKEAITKQDIKDLHKDGAITIKEIKGRRTIKKRKTRRRLGSVKKKVNTRKQEYVKITRKLRKHVAHLKKTKQIENSDFTQIRKEIRSRTIKTLAQMKLRTKEASA